MITQIERQQNAVRRMKQSPCQCLEYHPKIGTEIYKELLDEYLQWRQSKRHNVDKTWILVLLLASHNCPYIREERQGNQ